MALSAADYRGLLLNLLPKGPAWPTEPSDFTYKLADGLAQELARIDARADALLDEADPRSTLELLADWERVCGLPSPCLAGVEQTLAGRRAALVAHLTGAGGQTPAYYIGVAAAAGFAIIITEFRPWTFDRPFDVPMCGTIWAHAWQVNAPAETVTFWDFDHPFTDPFASWGNELLECLIKQLKPAHTTVLFAYT